MTPAPNPRAWAVAAALAAETGLGWGRWARGETSLECTCGEWGSGARLVHTSCPLHGADIPAHGRAFRDGPPRQTATPVPAPWDADAYRADCARRGVEPGPMPSRHGCMASGLDWCVFDNAIEFRSGTVKWFMRGDELQVTHTVVPITREQWVEIATLATAAKRAMGGP